MSENLESILNSVNRFINIDKNREKFSNHFTQLRIKVFENLQKIECFKKLLNGHSIQGSYGDNLKVNMPNEFDSVFMLKLPEFKLVKIHRDHQIPGNVLIDLTNVFNKIKTETHNAEIYNLLKKWVDGRNFLIVDKVQSWLTSCFQKAFVSLENKIVVNGKTARLRYSRQGPAHTVEVNGDEDFFYSVDFVPGFIFTSEQNIFKGIKGTWLAIPKPLKPPQPNSTSFRTSFYDQESELISNSKNLKNVLRMMKKFRDCHGNTNNLKSYYIKTIFMIKAEEHKNNKCYWEKPISEIVIEMFNKLEDTFIKKELPFFWDKQCNMYKHYSNQQLEEIRKYVATVKDKLIRGQTNMDEVLRFQIYCIFLTDKERESANIKKPNCGKSNGKEVTNGVNKDAKNTNDKKFEEHKTALPENTTNNTKNNCCIA